MKKVITLGLWFCSALAEAQQPAWGYFTGVPGSTEVIGVVKDDDGAIYIAGNFEPGYHSNDPRGIFVSKYDRFGNVTWLDSLHGTGRIAEILPERGKGIIITGGSINFCDSSSTFVRINKSGQVSSCLVPACPLHVDPDRLLAINSYNGNLYFLGLYEFDSLMNCLGPTYSNENEGVYGLALDGENNLFMRSFIYAPNSNNVLETLEKFDANGAFRWSYIFPVDTLVENYVTDPVGNCYVVAYKKYDMISEAFLYKFDPGGGLLWKDTLPYSVVYDGRHQGLYADYSGIYICGRYLDGHGEGMCINKYFRDGSLLWRYDLPDTPNSSRYLGSALVADNTSVYVTGSKCGEYSEGFLLKLIDLFPTGTYENAAGLNFTVRPNPSPGRVIIGGFHEGMSICIYDMLGRCVFVKDRTDETGQEEAAVLWGGARGIYFVRASGSTGSATRKIIIQ